MGCSLSTSKIGLGENGEVDNGSQDNSEYGDEGSDSAHRFFSKHDKETISLIRRDLNERPEIFVLNCVLMSTLFFENYQQEIKDVAKQRHRKGETVIEPDTLMEKANKNVTYRPFHGPQKDFSEPIVTKRIYVSVNESIEVFENMDEAESTNKGRKYQVKMEDCKRQGYVKLRELNSSTIPQDQASIKDLLVAPPSIISGSSDTESSENAYGDPSISQTTQDFILEQNNEQFSLSDCFVYRKVKKPDIDMDIEDMDHEHLKDEDVYTIVSYLTSRGFMKYFYSAIFVKSIGRDLGFIPFELAKATPTPGKIFCNLVDNDGNNFPCEIHPCLKMSWPEKQTFEFLFKAPLTNPNINPLWPTERMLEDIKRLDCVLVPKGFNKRQGNNPDCDLEWEMHFPTAERYLESFMSSEQIKCYLVLLALHKEYVEPFTKQYGLLPEHLRTLILWECENDYTRWPEHRLAVKLMNIIENLSMALRKRTLSDYFIQKKNLFRNISRKRLEVANEAFHRILQSPMMLIRVLRNLRYTRGRYYPPLDYKELLRILKKQNWEIQNPFISNGFDDGVSAKSVEKKPKFNDAEKQLEYVKQKEKKRRIERARKEKENAKNVTNLTYNVALEVRRGSQDTINDSWECEKPLDLQKKIALLKLFINTYINIARTSLKISTKKHALFYLKQAWYLTKILDEECALLGEEINDLFAKIRSEEEKCFQEYQNSLEKKVSVTNNNGDNHIINNNNNNNGVNDSLHVENADLSVTIEDQANAGLHQYLRNRTHIINLNSLSRSFNTNRLIADNQLIEDFR